MSATEIETAQRPKRGQKHAERVFSHGLTALAAARMMAAATVIVALLGGLLIWLLDHNEYSSLGDAMWLG